MSKYLKSIDWSHNLEYEVVDDYWMTYHLTGTGEYVTWLNVEYENVLVSIVPPENILSIIKAPPFPRGQMIPTP